MAEKFDPTQYNQEELTALVEQALSVAGTKGMEALTQQQKNLLLQLADSVDHTALTLGSTPEKVLQEAGRNPDNFLAKVRQARDFLIRRGRGKH